MWNDRGRCSGPLCAEDGKELLADETDWGLTGIDGAAAPGYQIYSSDNAVGDGSIITGRRVAAGICSWRRPSCMRRITRSCAGRP